MSSQRNQNSPGVFRAWLEVLRLPNLLTVPGDVIAGYALTQMATASAFFRSDLLFLIGASLSIYVAGLLLNDWKDRHEDARKRPERPLPSGRLSPNSVLAVSLLFLATGLTLSAMAGGIPLRVALLLAGCVIFYNTGARRNPFVGFITMGICRGANMLLGASLTTSSIGDPVLLAVLIYTAHIALLTWTADEETQVEQTQQRFSVTLTFLGVALTTFLIVAHPGSRAVGAALLAIAYPLICTYRQNYGRSGDGIGYVGFLVRGLIPVQATFALASSRMVSPLVMLFAGLLIIAHLTGRTFAGG